MKLLVSDFDRTLYTEDYLTNIKKVNEFVDNGNMLVIATGRNLPYLKEVTDGLNIKYSYLICNDGAVIFDKYDNMIFCQNIETNIVKPILEVLESDNNIEFALIRTPVSFTKDYNTIANMIIAKPFDITKADKTLSLVLEKFPEISGYLSASWVNLCSKKASKGNAVKYLSELLNIPSDNIYTVGDHVNDISMCEMFNGYAIEYGHPDLIKVTKKTVKSVSELIDLINNK